MSIATGKKRRTEPSGSGECGIGLPQSHEELELRIQRARADRRLNGPKNVGGNADNGTKEIAGCGE